jgi:IS30 family transposase
MQSKELKTGKHLTLKNRITTEFALNEGKSFAQIAKELGKCNSTISKEVRRNREALRVGFGPYKCSDCINRKTCTKEHVCPPEVSCHYTWTCSRCGRGYLYCDDYKKEVCPRLYKPPYVCNNCENRKRCILEKQDYRAANAQTKANVNLIETRKGINLTEDQFLFVDNLVADKLKKGQSFHHIYENNKDEMIISERSFYRYMNGGLLTSTKADTPRMSRFKPRKTPKDKSYKINRKCKINRSFEDFEVYMKDNSDVAVVEMDSVEGKKGGKVLLTIHFVNCHLMLAFLRDRNNSQSVIDVFNHLYELLGRSTFKRLFPILKTDNGSEFSNPEAIEYDNEGNLRTRIFYCHPYCSNEKGACEVNHQFIRRAIPKGTSMDSYTQKDIDKIMSNINSYGRASLGNLTPYKLFAAMYGVDLLKKLNLELIEANEINLKN